MKKSLLSLGSVLLLAGCSGGGSGSGGMPGTPKLGGDINPLARPSNPAPISYLQSIQALAKNADKYVPEERALFSEIFYGDYVSKTEEGGEDQKRAIEKLSPEGLRFRDRIKANCALTPVNVEERSKTSTPAKKNEVASKKLSQFSAGANCEYIYSKSADVTKTYLDGTDYNPETHTSVTKVSEVQVESESVEIRNAQIVALAGTKSRKSTMTSKETSESSYSPKASAYSYSRSSASTFENVMANGHVIKGTTESYSRSVQTRDEKGTEVYESESIAQTKAKTPQGDIWITFVYKKGDTQDIYLNGKKLTAEEAQKIGMTVKN